MSKSVLLLRIFLFVVSGCFFLQGSSQEKPYLPAKVIPPSPTAASLETYGNYSIGYYTGTPDITIPIYEITTPNHKLPIRLNYNAIGVRVSESASWVGLGWSLSTGGAITRTIVGLDDFGGNGYYTAEAIPAEVVPRRESDKAYFDEMLAGRKDTDPDIISYNFGEYAGKFAMSKLADGSKVFMDQQNNLKVEFFQTQAKWVITDGKGYKYYFGYPEVSWDYSYMSTTNELADDAPLSAYQASTNPASANAWYLDSIVAPTNEKITFTYEVRSNSLSLVNKTEQEDNMIGFVGTCTNPSSQLRATYKKFVSSRQVVPDVYLKKIQFNLGVIEFSTSDRQDIEYINTAKPQKLSEIIVKDLAGSQIKRFRLVHSYFNSNAGIQNWRLKLDSLVEYGRDNQSKPPHWFTYVSPNQLPPKYSKSIDHWGFYNKQNNNTLLPSITAVSQTNGQTRIFKGANRRPDSQVETINPGIIASINYPTGGSTVFDFELNEYRNLNGDEKYDIVVAGPTAYASPYDQTQMIKTFTISGTEPVLLEFRYGYSKSAEGPDLMEGVQVVYGYLYKTGETASINSFHNWDWQTGQAVGPGNYQTITQILSPGTYRLEVRYIQNYTTEVKITYDEKVPVTQRKGGGLRIKSITNYENGKKVNVRKFQYVSDGVTTGKVISPVDYSYYSVAQEILNWGACPPNEGHYIGRLSHSIRSAALSSKGTIVGYDKVIEIIGENGEGGRNEYTFINDEESTFGNDKPSTPAFCNPLSGKLAVVATYDNAGTLVKKVDYNYSTRKTENLTGVKIFSMGATASEISTLSSYYTQYYRLFSSWTVLDEEIETLYNSDRSIIVSKKYYYQNEGHKAVTRQETTSSDGVIEIKKFKRPGDYAQPGTSSFVSQMKSRNIISPVIEEQTLVSASGIKKLVAGQVNEYKLYNNAFYMPGIIYGLETSTPLADTTESSINATSALALNSNYKPKYYYDAYTTAGNISQMHKASDENISYLWDYQSSYPVAEVTGAAQGAFGYTSFEADSKGGWNYSGTPVNEASAPTGKRVYSFNGSNPLTKSGLSSAGIYTVSYWTKNSTAFTITGTQAGYPIGGRSVTGWKYFEHRISGQTQISIGAASGLIDELRIHPVGARMTTFSHEPLTGIICNSDANSNISYFEYDGFGRLLRIRDNTKNIAKKFEYQYLAFHHANAVWQATGNTRCKPCPQNSNYTTNVSQKEEKDINPQSTTYNQLRWTDVGTNSSCVVTPNWQNTGSPVCLTDANGYRTGVQRTVQKDMNPCSPTFNQTRNIDVSNTTACPPNAPNWQNTPNTRCKPCSTNAAYITNILQQEQRDNNPNSSTYNQLRWVDAGTSSSCVLAVWQNTNTPLQCEKVGGVNTGDLLREQKDMNPCSSTYNQIRWIFERTDYVACPTQIYAKITHENETAEHTADVVVRFYSDAACTSLRSVSNLRVDWGEELFNDITSETTYQSFTTICNGSEVILLRSAVLREQVYEQGVWGTYYRSYYLVGNGNYEIGQ